MGFGWILLIALVLAVIGGVLQGNSNAKKNAARGDNLKSKIGEDGFTPTKTIMGVKNLYTFAVDDTKQKIRILTENSSKTISYEDVISVEIIEDNKVFSKKSTMRTVGGAVAGGVLAGGVGALVGGLSGSSTDEKKVSSVQVAILLRDMQNPKVVIDCFNASTMTTEGKREIKVSSMEGYLYKMGIEHANQIKDTVSVIIDMVDSKEPLPSKSTNTNLSMAEQLEKLHSLKEKGVLTEDEFIEQKRKLLS